MGRSHGFHTKVVGVTHKNDDGTSRQTIIARCKAGEWLQLVYEPDNPHDSNAIKVCRQNGEQIGYLASGMARDIARDREEHGGPVYAQIAGLTGGGRKTRGVNIWICFGKAEPSPDLAGHRGCLGVVAIVAVAVVAALLKTLF